MRKAFISVIPILIVAAACGGNSPVEPSGNGASITGQFVSPGRTGNTRGIQAASPNASVQGITVSVSGTAISAAVKGGQFSLSGVPAGPLSLRFTGSGTDSELGLEPVEGSEDIDLTVSLNGSTVTLESERRSFGREIQLEGLVDSLALPNLVVAGQNVMTDGLTRYFLRGKQADSSALAVGFRVHVKGQLNGTGALVASVIMIQNTNVGDDEEELDDEEDQVSSASVEGILTSIGGTAPALTLQVGNTVVRTSGSTQVQRKGDTQDLSVLDEGMLLHVVGVRRPDTSIDARKIQIKDDTLDGEVEIQGSMGGVKGTCAAMTFSINGYKIATDADTDFNPACTSAAYKSGTKVTVNGTMQGNGTILAETVTK